MPRDLTPDEIDRRYGSGAFYEETPAAGLGTRFGASIDRAQAGLIGIGEAAGLDWGDWRRENEIAQEQSLQRYYASNPNEPRSFRDINGIGSGLRYMRGLAIDSAPELATSLAALPLGVYAGLGMAGRTALGAAMNTPSALGDVLQNQREEAGRTDLTSAVPLAIPYVAADMVGLEGALARGRMMRTGLKSLDEMQGLRGVAARTGANAGLNFVAEGAGETTQEMVNQLGRIAVNPTQTLFNQDANERYLESFIGGGLLGAGVSSALGGWRRSEDYQPRTVDDGQFDVTQRQQSVAIPQQYDLRTVMDPLQERIDQNLGINRQRRSGYAKQFAAAYDEPSGQYAVDPTTGLERQLSMGELQQIQLGTAPVAEKQQQSTTTATASPVMDEIDQGLTELNIPLASGKKTRQAQRDLYQAAVDSGIPLEDDLLTPFWTAMAERKTGEKTKVMLQNAIVEHRKGQANASEQSAPAIGPGGSSVGGSPDANGSVGVAGPVATGGGVGSGNAVGTGAADVQAVAVPSAGTQPVTPLGQNTSILPGSNPPSPRATPVAKTQQSDPFQVAPEVQGRVQDLPLVDTSEDAAEIARMTGNSADVDAYQADEMGERVDAAPAEANQGDLDRVIEARFAGSKNAERDGKILRAYLTAMRNAPKGSKGAIQAAIGKRFGVSPESVRAIGNPQALARSAESLGMDREQVFGLLGISDNAKAESSEASQHGYRLQQLKKAYAEATTDKRKERIARLMSRRAELLAKAKEKAAQDREAAVASGLREAGVEFDAEEGSGMGGLDEDRLWERESAKGSKDAIEFIKMAEQEEALREALAEYEQQGMDEVAEKVREQIVALQKAMEEMVNTINSKVDTKAAAKVEDDVALTDSEKAGRAWNEAASEYPEAPRWEDLNAEERENFIEYGEDNWSPEDVQAELTRLAKSGRKFGKAATAKNPYTATELLMEISRFVRADIPNRKLIVVDSISDLIGSKDKTLVALGVSMQLEGAYGVASDGRAILIADRIEKGQGRGKFMHEVGAHLGLERLLPKALYDKLTQQLVDWAKKDDGSIESEIAQAAAERVMSAGTVKEDQRSELLAYFLEEADKRGIDPTAAEKTSGPLRDWFRTLWAAFKVAVRKLGFKPEALTAQDVIDMAFGAARLEITGTFHGTGQQFRRFNHKYMGSGEGAQAYGWGTYLAQRFGIAKDYWEADVRRKTPPASNDVAYSYGGLNKYQQDQVYYSDGGTPIKLGLTLNPLRVRASGLYIPTIEVTGSKTPGALSYKAADQIFKKDGSPLFSDQQIAQMQGYVEKSSDAPEGAVMRVDVGVNDDEVLDWDTPLRLQTPVLELLEEKLPADIRELLEEDTNLDLAEMTGEDLYRGLQNLELRDSILSEQFDVDDYNSRLANNAQAKRIVSAYLDEKIGIPALRFLDAVSRNMPNLDRQIARAKERVASAEQHLNSMLQATESTRARFQNSIASYEKKIADLEANGSDLAKAGLMGMYQNFLRTQQENLKQLDDPNSNDAILNKAAQESLDRAREKLAKLQSELTSPTTRNLVVFNDKNIFRVSSRVNNERSKMKFGKAAEPPSQGLVNKNIAKLPPKVQPAARQVTSTLNRRVRKGLDTLVFTSDLVKRASDAGLKSAKTFRDLIVRQATRARELEREVERIADMYAMVPEKDRTGDRSVNQFLFESTRQGKWGYANKNMKADAEMAEWFDSLDAKSQDFVKAVFEHGDRMLQVKKDTVMKFTASEYDAHIQQLEQLIADGITGRELENAKEELAQVKRDKRNDLNKFARLFQMQEGRPYAPIKRFGPYAVVAKSQAYMDAVAAKDMKKVRELEQSEDDYHVSFTETAAEAEALANELDTQGSYAQVQHFERAVNEDGLYGDQSMMQALTNLRSRINASDRPGTSQLQQMVTQMWLQNLAESSARKSEMRRRGVSGEVDMLRSFTSQGRADANFLAATQYGSDVQDAMQSMHKETREARDRTRASEVMNEFDRRYRQTFERTSNPWMDKLRRMSSIYFLATSPAYYLQNLTQPWMMSVPAMTGAHNYAKIHAELGKAYAEMKAVVKSGGLLNQMFDYNTVPGDVRTAIQELVNRGKIDIGMDTELGQFRVEGHGYFKDKINKIDKGLRLAIMKVESINRLSTAMTAYRLERAEGRSHEQALEYADRILTETHGDYTAFNAPRAFNTELGKVALQFRKFQLLQVGYYAKLINDIFTNPKERVAALRMLGYSLAHTAALAGVRGLPGFATFAWVVGKLVGDDDEPYNLEQSIRNAIGDEDVANLVLRGMPTLVGADISGKVGAGNMLSVTPFSDADLSTRAGMAEWVGTLLGGAALGMTTRMVDGLGQLLSGNYLRGLELLMPKGVGDAIKAGRIADEGMTRRNGEILMSPEDVSFWDTTLQALGITPVKQSVAYEKQRLVKDMDQNFRDRSTQIKSQYIKAMRERDAGAATEARQAWTKLQEARVRNGYTKQPLSNLLKAPQEQAKREKNTTGGVQFNKQNRKFVESQV